MKNAFGGRHVKLLCDQEVHTGAGEVGRVEGILPTSWVSFSLNPAYEFSPKGKTHLEGDK
jgi:hypothetical protein